MTWPTGVRTATLSASSALSVLGRDFPGTLTVSADFGNVDSLTWAATGEVFIDLDDSASTPGIVEFPHPAQTGWIDPAGNAVTGWSLNATLRYGPAGSRVTLHRRFTLSSNVDEVDFRDLLDDQESEPDTVAMYAPVDDTAPSDESTYSSAKILALISQSGGGATPIEYPRTGSTWIVNHSLGRKPNVALFVGDEQVFTKVVATATTVSAIFPNPATGVIVLT